MKYINRLLHRSTASPKSSPSPTNSDNDHPVSKTPEHEVKVRFAREFADVGSVAVLTPESLSSASSFHSLSSTLSTKSSSGICPDSTPSILDDIANTSYVDANIPGVEDLILACANIHIENEQSCAADNSQDLSQDLDQTFASATDESPFHASDCSLNEDLRPDSVIGNETQVIEANSQLHETTYISLNQTHIFGSSNDTIFIRDTQSVTPSSLAEETSQVEETIDRSVLSEKNDNTANEFETGNAVSNTIKDSLPTSNVNNQLNVTTITSSDSSILSVIAANEEQVIQNDHSGDVLVLKNLELYPVEVSIPATPDVLLAQYAKDLSLPSILENTNSEAKENSAHDLSEPTRDISSTVILPCDDTDQKLFVSPLVAVNNSSLIQADNSDVVQQEDNCVVSNIKENSTQLSDKTSITEPKLSEIQENLQRNKDTRDLEIRNSAVLNETQTLLHKEDIVVCNETRILEEQNNLSETVIKEEEENTVKSVSVDAVKEKEASIEEDLDRTLTLQDLDLDVDFTNVPDEEQYSDFKPQRQSTTLSLIKEQPNFEEFKLEAEEITNNLLSSALDIAEETSFVSATSEIFQDPSTFDFLLARSNSNHTNRLRQQSLYVKFDPLVSNTNMLPQSNAQPINEEQNGKSESPLPDVSTPKRNPAIAAIDRLLFYSPLPGTVQKSEEAQEKNEQQPVEESKTDAPHADINITDVNMVKELELVRTTVLQLEEELKKQKKEHEVELEKQKTTFQEKINKLQAQMAQEVKTKTQMTVVVEEYEKSISRLLTERERDRTNFEQEKAKLQEELQAANHHLTNTEAAFNDVHQKYERLKGVVSVYKNNETVLKESIQENVETIKMLETRYDQLKDHAMAQLEKANLELDGIRKQNEAETVKLHAMIRKAELRSTSLSELVEQKTKENKELSKILDEVIARVGHGNPE